MYICVYIYIFMYIYIYIYRRPGVDRISDIFKKDFQKKEK